MNKLLVTIFTLIATICTWSNASAEPQGTSITYQGELQMSGLPANGEFDFQFKLFSVADGGIPIGLVPITIENLVVTDGIFTTDLDFLTGVFAGDQRWLEIGVRDGASVGAYTTLQPRQILTSTPYALHSLSTRGIVVGQNGNVGIQGNVSIGTTSPTTKLNVEGPGWPDSFMTLNSNGGDFDAGLNLRNDGDLKWHVFNQATSDNFNIRNAAFTPLFVIGQDGNVGIGTDSTTAGLNLEGAGFPDSFMILNSTGGNLDSGFRLNNDGVTKWHLYNQATPGDDLYILNSGGVTVLKAEQGGNIGIGTAAPLTRLHMKGAGFPESFMTLEGSGGDFDAGLNIKAAGVVKWHIYNRSSDSDEFRIVNESDEEVIVATQSGLVGIGTTSPLGKLDVNGAIFQRGSSLHADYVFKPEYKLETIEEHSTFMWTEGHLPAVPKAIKDANGLEIVEVGSHRRGILEELEKAHIYIERLNSENERLADQLEQAAQRLARLEQLVSQLN